MIDINDFTLEQLANALHRKGVELGYPKVTDKSKWREPVMAEKLGHLAHKNISAGANSVDYGSDATTAEGKKAEYKTMSIEDDKIRNLVGAVKSKKTGAKFSALTVSGVYNGAYKQEAIDAYANIEHYFGVFHEEQCVIIVRPMTKHVIQQLTENNNRRKPGQTTNCNTASFNLESDADKFETVFVNKEWFDLQRKRLTS